MTQAPFRDLERLQSVLQALKIPYAVIGGWAVITWGFVRASEDIDLLIDLPLSRKKELLAALSTDYQASWIDGGQDDPIPGLIRALPKTAGTLPVDMLPARSLSDKEAISKALPVKTGGVTSPIVRPEDLIAMKLEAGGGQDYEDVRRLLEIIQDLDESLLEQTCAARKVLDRLALLRRK